MADRGYNLPVFHLEALQEKDKAVAAQIFQILSEAGIQFVICDRTPDKEKALTLYQVNGIDIHELLEVGREIAELYKSREQYTSLSICTGAKYESND